MDDDVLIRLRISPVRRTLALAVICAFAFLLIYIAFARPPENLGWRVFLVALGVASLVLADKMRRDTATTLILTDDALAEEGGRELAAIKDIESVDRGFTAFKPSNGFVIKTYEKAPGAWAPGFWWRVGRRIGVGGITVPGEAKAMAEIMQSMLKSRDQS